jgi:6,7-dimethyl-8-ribityllumazine synthase
MVKVITSKELTAPFRIAIIVSRFNEEIVQRLLEGALERLRELNVPDDLITVVWVPGAIEIPIVAQRLARTENYEVVITLGCVIRGETSHYDYVCEQVSSGCQTVSLQNNVPVIFGVLTTETEQQAMDRAGGKYGNKGRDAVDAAFETVAVLRQI